MCISQYACWLPRIAFGLIFISYGVNHYRNLANFIEMAKSVFPAGMVLGTISGALAYIVPALMIIGGFLYAIRQLCFISKVCILASLSGIIGWASLAIMFDNGSIPNIVPNMGGAIQNATLLLVLYFAMKKSKSCCSTPSMK